MSEMMVRLLCFILISGLVFQCVRTEGSVGCLFSSSLCEDEEECFDDNAFGRCQTAYGNNLDYRHQIGPETIGLLEREFTRLFAGGYRWRHEYTQCVVQNILFSNRHSITYDPGLCARLMHLTLPYVPPEILEELESPDPDELAYIKFQPNQDDPEGYIFAEEIFNPSAIEEKEPELKDTEKRSPKAVDSSYLQDDWETNSYNNVLKTDKDTENTAADKEAIFRKLLEIADDTGKLFEQFQTNNADRYPDEDTPIIRTDLSSDLNQRPAYTEGGTQWIPVDEDSNFLMGNDIIDRQEKKRIRDENEIIHNNDIPLYGKVKYGDNSYRKEIDPYPKGINPYPKEINSYPKEIDSYPKEISSYPKEMESYPKEISSYPKEISSYPKEISSYPKEIDSYPKEVDSFPKEIEENDMEEVRDNPSYENIPQDDEDKNFRWNYKHINKAIDNDLTRFARGNKNGMRRVPEPPVDNNIKDVIEDDYLEDQLYAFLPLDNGMSTFTRDMRYDTKKPGPTYMLHEDEDGDTTNDGIEMAEEDAQALLSRLSKSAREHQLQHLTKTPVVAQKSSTLVVPSREVIEGVQRVVLTGGNEIPDDIEINRSDQRSKGKTFERLREDQPELLEGIDDLSSNDMKDEDRMANAAKTGEGHIGSYDSVDATQAYLLIKEKDKTEDDAKNLVASIGSMLNLPKGSFSNVRIRDREVLFKVNPNMKNLNASDVASKAEENYSRIKDMTGITIEAAGIGDKVKYEVINPNKERRLFILAFALCGGVAGILLAVAAAYLVRRHSRFREKLQNVTQPDTEPSQDYQDLCRQRMASKSNDKPENIHSAVHSPKRIRSLSQEGQASSSSHSSTSSWNEEPVTSNMDITTGHIILAYMEDHLKNKDRLDREWEGLCAYEAELCSTTSSTLPVNIKKNRYTDVLPYDHSRVLLTEVSNVASCDYINASSITDHDPRNPAYIATQGPLPQTAADFWQMIWEQGSVVIVMLSRLMENGVAMCHRYWPEEGSEVYHIYEVHLVSEHIWCDDYLVRSFYLKNLRTNETRTVTQFHFMSWPDNGVPNSTKALLEFRRKVNKSYRGRSCPIVVHCSDGIGRTGTYCLIDMVLNRMAKGAKEIDIAATLEHVRDQRAGMVKTKAQFEFVLMAIAEEVHAILKALSQ